MKTSLGFTLIKNSLVLTATCEGMVQFSLNVMKKIRLDWISSLQKQNVLVKETTKILEEAGENGL